MQVKNAVMLDEARQTKSDLERCQDHKVLKEYKLSEVEKKLFVGWVPARLVKTQKIIDRHVSDKIEIDRLLAIVNGRISGASRKRKSLFPHLQ